MYSRKYYLACTIVNFDFKYGYINASELTDFESYCRHISSAIYNYSGRFKKSSLSDCMELMISSKHKGWKTKNGTHMKMEKASKEHVCWRSSFCVTSKAI